MKICTVCEKEKPESEYYHRTNAKGERVPLARCKECAKEYGRNHGDEYRTRGHVKKRQAKYQAEYRARPEVIEHTRIREAAYRARPEVRKRNKAWHYAHTLTPKGRAAMLDRVHQRRARIAGAEVVEVIDRRIVYQRDNGICHICNIPAHGAWELDHIIPLILGGDHSYANVAVSHRRCNRKKSGKIL